MQLVTWYKCIGNSLERAVKNVGNWLCKQVSIFFEKPAWHSVRSHCLRGVQRQHLLKTDSSDTFKGHSSVIGRGELSAAKGSKTFIGARKALLIVLAMSCKVGGVDWPQSMCWYSVAGSGQPDALDIPLSFFQLLATK